MKPNARVALLSSGPPLSLKTLYCLQVLGAETNLIDIGTPSIAKHSRYKAHYLNVRTETGHAGAQDMEIRAIEYITQNNITHVVPGDIAAAGFLYCIRDRLPGIVVFPVSSKDILELLDDKWQFAELLRKNSINAPATNLLESHTDLYEVEQGRYKFPLVIKPLHGESGHGVKLFNTPDQWRKYFGYDHIHTNFPCIIQEYARGIDADVSVLAHNGKVYAQVLQLRRIPDVIEFGRNEQALTLAKQIIAATQFSGVANIDLRIDPQSGEVKVIECNPRFWYTLQASLWGGLNFVKVGLDLAQGVEVTIAAPENGRYYYHGYIAKRILHRPWRWSDVPDYNWSGFWQAASDPLPFLTAEIRKLKMRIFSKK